MKLTTLAYIKQNGKTLMLHKARGYQQGKWNGLGGKFAPGESPEACLKREVFEESGLQVEKAQLKGFITFPKFDDVEDTYVFVYTVTKASGTIKASDEGELRWVADDEVMGLNLWEGDRVFLPWLERPGLFSAIFHYESGIFQNYKVTFYDT